MTTFEHEHDHGHAEGEHAMEHAHPGAKTYTLIGVVLAIITIAEVFFYTQESVRAFLVPLLLVLSASKFALVVGFYMHLRFDHPLFFGVFGFGLLARVNRASVVGLGVGAASVASAIFLIVELSTPYSGLLQLSPTPVLQTIEALNK